MCFLHRRPTIDCGICAFFGPRPGARGARTAGAREGRAAGRCVARTAGARQALLRGAECHLLGLREACWRGLEAPSGRRLQVPSGRGIAWLGRRVSGSWLPGLEAPFCRGIAGPAEGATPPTSAITAPLSAGEARVTLMCLTPGFLSACVFASPTAFPRSCPSAYAKGITLNTNQLFALHPSFATFFRKLVRAARGSFAGMPEVRWIPLGPSQARAGLVPRRARSVRGSFPGMPDPRGPLSATREPHEAFPPAHLAKYRLWVAWRMSRGRISALGGLKQAKMAFSAYPKPKFRHFAPLWPTQSRYFATGIVTACPKPIFRHTDGAFCAKMDTSYGNCRLPATSEPKSCRVAQRSHLKAEIPPRGRGRARRNDESGGFRPAGYKQGSMSA